MPSASEMLYGENARFPSCDRSDWYRSSAKALLPCTSVDTSSAGTAGSWTRFRLERAAPAGDGDGAQAARSIDSAAATEINSSSVLMLWGSFRPCLDESAG